jgi:hypothetical protein
MGKGPLFGVFSKFIVLVPQTEIQRKELIWDVSQVIIRMSVQAARKIDSKINHSSHPNHFGENFFHIIMRAYVKG